MDFRDKAQEILSILDKINRIIHQLIVTIHEVNMDQTCDVFDYIEDIIPPK